MSHVFPGPGEGGLDPVKGSWDIKGLEEGQGFEVRLQAKNRWEINIIEKLEILFVAVEFPPEKLIFEM